MPTTAYSYGTCTWLATLIEAGWQLSVVEHHTPGQHVTLRLVEDDFEPLDLAAPDLRTVGVMAEKVPDGVFVPTSSKAEAVELLDRAYREVTE